MGPLLRRPDKAAGENLHAVNRFPRAQVQHDEIIRPPGPAAQSLVISIRGDRDTPYSMVDQMQDELVAAGVVRVVFATQLEQRMQRERR